MFFCSTQILVIVIGCCFFLKGPECIQVTERTVNIRIRYQNDIRIYRSEAGLSENASPEHGMERKNSSGQAVSSTKTAWDKDNSKGGCYSRISLVVECIKFAKILILIF